MNAVELAKMMCDEQFFNLKKLQYKYSALSVAEMLQALAVMSYDEISLRDCNGNSCVYMPAQCTASTGIIRQLVSEKTSQDTLLQAIEDEAYLSLQLEKILPCEKEKYINGMVKGIGFIGDFGHEITEENLYRLYMMCLDDSLNDEEMLAGDIVYRNDNIASNMADFVCFANQKDGISEPIKACILHFYIAYLQPYYKANGIIARLVHQWYLVQQGFSSTLSFAFSKHISQSMSRYYNTFTTIEDNYKISSVLDITPFIRYFIANVYNKIEGIDIETPTNNIFEQAMDDGVITDMEQDLWGFVTSTYVDDEFSIKQVETGYGNAAYTTVRNFVLKFEALGLLASQKFGRRTKFYLK